MKDLPDLTKLSIVEPLHHIKNESVLIRKSAVWTVLVSPDGFPDSGDFLLLSMTKLIMRLLVVNRKILIPYSLWRVAGISR